jgi:alpha-beta hydrolase superfamily lysophospholipase
MGGAIGMTYEQNPNDFNAAAFSSPMLRQLVEHL